MEYHQFDLFKNLERRIGRFRIDTFIMRKQPELVMALMGTCIIYEAEHRLMFDAIEYVALNEDFEEIGHGIEPPLYNIIVTETANDITLTFEKAAF